MRQTLPILTVKFRIHTLPRRQDLPHKARDWATPIQMLLRAGSCPERFLSPCLWEVGGVAISARGARQGARQPCPLCPDSSGR